MTKMEAIVFSWPIAMYIVGILTRALLPWIIKIIVQLRSEAPEQIVWSWRYLLGQVLTAVVVLVVTPLLVDDPSTITSMTMFEAWSVGFSVAAIGRELDKLLTAFASK